MLEIAAWDEYLDDSNVWLLWMTRVLGSNVWFGHVRLSKQKCLFFSQPSILSQQQQAEQHSHYFLYQIKSEWSLMVESNPQYF